MLLRGGSSNNKENAAIVLSQLLEENNVPPVVWAYARIALRQSLIKEAEDGLLSSTRSAVLNRLISIGGSNSEAAEQIIILLLQLAEKDKLDIKPFLNGEKRQRLLQNYRKFAPTNTSQKGRKEFEKQIMQNQ